MKTKTISITTILPIAFWLLITNCLLPATDCFAQTISCGNAHSMAICNDGTVRDWGLNDRGQLGDNTTTKRNTPVQVHGTGNVGFLTGITAVAGSKYYCSLALKNDSTVWAWGYNNAGQLGDSTTIQRITPVQVRGTGNVGFLTGITAVAAGLQQSLALKSDGTVWAWGSNSGELGDNTFTQRTTPVQVHGTGNVGFLTGITAVAGGVFHSLAVKSDGTVWTWGGNSAGELGDGTTTIRKTPVQVIGLTGITAVAGGFWYSLALKNDGTVWAWGYNTYGNLGDGTTTQRLTPVQVSGLTGITAIAAGAGFSSLALKSDGTVWAWGANGGGVLGDNTTTQRNTPVQVHGTGNVGFLTGITAVANGGGHSLALKNDGTLWAWGNNGSGQLGDGTATPRMTPVQTIGLCTVMSPCPVIANAGKDTTICKGNSAILTASGGISYSWNTGNPKDTTASIMVSPSSSTTYTVSVSDGKCNKTDSVKVTVTSLLASVSGNTTVCPGDSTTLTASGGTKYTWITTIDTIPSINIKPVKDTLYKVTVSNGGICPDTTLSINIAIFDTASSIAGVTSICMGDSTVLTASSGNKYQWSTTDSTMSITVKPTTDATYTVKILNGKCSSNPSVKVTVTPFPVADAGKDTTVCVGNKVTLTASGGATGATYIWNPTTNLSSSTISNPTVTAISTTKYVITIANGKCIAKDSVMLIANLLPVVSAGNDATINKGDSVVLQASGAITYLWKPLSGLSDSTIANPTAKPTTTIIYIVTGTDVNGCSSKDSVTITIKGLECKEFFIPNAFSPNGNGFNDSLYVRGCTKEVKEVSFAIYDRWGEKVFETTDITKGWDGTYKGKALNTAVFVYYMKATLTTDEVIEQKGNISLIR